jgi:hypothetical protein
MKRENRLRRAALVLALLVLAAIVTGVAWPAETTVIPRQLTGSWQRENMVLTMVVSPQGKISIHELGVYHARFSHVTTHRLSISGYSCSGTGTYRWTILNHGDVIGEPGHELTLKKIHDACKGRIDLFARRWFKAA